MGRRGKPSKRSNPPGTSDGSLTVLSSTNFPPVTDRDEELVECMECQLKCTFRQFRLHNLDCHYNLATSTADNDVVKDYRFYQRKLNEMSKVVKISMFKCPRPECTSSYKSALGLSYHLETCGKSKEEIEACMVPCELCQKMFTLPNLQWHKRSKHCEATVQEPVLETSSLPASSMKGRKRMTTKKILDSSEHSVDDYNDESPEQDPDDNDNDADFDPRSIKAEEWVYEPPINIFLNEETDEVNRTTSTSKTKAKSESVASCPDLHVQALRYLQSTSEDSNVWDAVHRNLVNPIGIEVIRKHNALQDIHCESTTRLYLPGMEKSFELKTSIYLKTEDGQRVHAFTNYRRLAWFESEIVDSDGYHFIAYTGGPVSSMAWHPSGNYLAVSTLKHYLETPDVVLSMSRQSSIQIYSRIPCPEPTFAGSRKSGSKKHSVPPVAFEVALTVGMDYGYVNHLQWGNFWPKCCDSEYGGNEDASDSDDNVMGYLCCAFEDGTCRIFSLNINDFQREPNCSLVESKKLRVYKKVPEIILTVSDAIKQSKGQCTRFDWHEGNRYLVTGYASGLIAVFDLETKSKLLKKELKDGDASVVTINPFWVFHGHRWPIRGITFDPSNPRYFHTGSMDRLLKAWDMDLRQEIESKKVGMVLDTCWIRGWIHVAVSTDFIVSSYSTQHNYTRFYQVASSQGRPNVIQNYSVTSIGFHEGMTADGTENGRVTVTYFDSFWRDCDFERNKRKKNAVNISKIELDEESAVPLSEDWEADRARELVEPRMILSFVKERVQGHSQLQKPPTPQQAEHAMMYYHMLRVNKVSWCPNGKYLAVGYRNGLLTIIPATFDILYNSF